MGILDDLVVDKSKAKALLIDKIVVEIQLKN
jgi:hypothetical protein